MKKYPRITATVTMLGLISMLLMSLTDVMAAEDGNKPSRRGSRGARRGELRPVQKLESCDSNMVDAEKMFAVTAITPQPAQCQRQCPMKGQPQEEDPYSNARVLIEAFVVEVDNAELSKTKLSPLGESSKALTVDKILTCLDKGTAKITDGAKLSVAHNNVSDMATEQTKYYKLETEARVRSEGQPAMKDISYRPYNTSVNFTAYAIFKAADLVRVDFEFKQDSVDTVVDANTPPSLNQRKWKNAVLLKDGQPSIVGAIGSADKTVFLVLTANIQK